MAPTRGTGSQSASSRTVDTPVTDTAETAAGQQDEIERLTALLQAAEARAAQAANAQHKSSARMEALAAFIAAQPVQRFGRSPALAAPLMRTRSSDYFAGAAAGGLKSTFGAVEISFSFSTAKFAFCLYPNTIAVRLVGNERMVTL